MNEATQPITYVRRGATLTASTGVVETLASVNKAKRRSRDIQQAGRGLGRGDVRVAATRKRKRGKRGGRKHRQATPV